MAAKLPGQKSPVGQFLPLPTVASRAFHLTVPTTLSLSITATGGGHVSGVGSALPQDGHDERLSAKAFGLKTPLLDPKSLATMGVGAAWSRAAGVSGRRRQPDLRRNPGAAAGCIGPQSNRLAPYTQSTIAAG